MPRIRVRCRFNAGAVDHTFVLVRLEDFGVGGGNTMNYLQVVRGPQYAAQGGENSGSAHLYWGNLTTGIKKLITEVSQHFGVSGENPDAGPDAILRAPSSRNLNCPYYGLIKRTFWNAVDLSSHISKGAVSSGAPGTSFNDVLNDYHFAGAGFPQLPEEPVIVVVDDVFSTGKTIAAIIERFQPHVPAGTSYVLACPLRIPFTPAQLLPLGIQIDTEPL